MLLLKKDDEDDFDGTVRTPNHKCVEIKVPKEVVRVLIGRNGKNIKQIQEQSNTKINFRDVDGVDKVCLFLVAFVFIYALINCLGLCYSRNSRGVCCGTGFGL